MYLSEYWAIEAALSLKIISGINKKKNK